MDLVSISIPPVLLKYCMDTYGFSINIHTTSTIVDLAIFMDLVLIPPVLLILIIPPVWI